MLKNKSKKLEKKEFKGKIGRRLVVGMLIVALAPLIFGGYISYTSSKDALIGSSLDALALDVKTHALEAEVALNSYSENMLFLANVPPVQGIIRASESDEVGIDPLTGISESDWLELLSSAFEEIAKTHDAYLQVRYLDEDGQELVRIDSGESGVTIKRGDELQNKGDRYYFTDTMALDEGELFVSPLDLNKEGSPPEIEVPYVPVIRYGTPVFSESTGERKGIVIVNIKAEVFLNALSDLSFVSDLDIGSGEHEFLVDSDGYYFINPDTSKEWGGPNDLNTGENLHNDFSEDIASLILSGGSGAIEIEEMDEVLAFYPIYPNSGDQDYYWVVAAFVSRDLVLAPVLALQNIFALLAIVFAAVALIFSFIYSQSISRPIIRLAKTAAAIGSGNLSDRFEVKTRDEIGFLGNTINEMADQILQARVGLEEKVEVRTSELNEKKNSLEGQQRAILNILEDIEEERGNVSREKDKIDTILHSIGDGVFVIDKNDKVFMFNNAAAMISGFSADEIVGNKCSDFIDFVYEKEGNSAKRFIDDAMSIGERRELPMHSAIVTKSKQKVSVSATAAPLKDRTGSVTGAVVVFKDISKEAAIDKAKTEFVSLASHQLRTPLSAINWYTEMLLAGDAGKLTKKQKEFLDEIFVGSQRMVELVGALLNVSRLELGTFTIEPEMLDITEISDAALDELGPKIEERKMKVTKKYPDEAFKMSLDKNLVFIIFQNLLSNAVKYTPVGGSVHLDIIKTETKVKIVVKDSGIGIPEDQHDKIFSKLFRADNVRASDTDGTGLGLYIIKSILDGSGGSISFTSEEGKGTEFTAILPLSGMKKKKGSKKIENV